MIVVHTAESHPDEVGPDTGAEEVARFIATRTTYGSYHDLADSDSIVALVPYSMQAYGDGTGSNPHAYHVSAASQAAKWPSLPRDWRLATVDNMARAAARFEAWCKDRYGFTIPARRITKAESDRRVEGFLAHGDRDPGRRTDPGKSFPWEYLFERYEAHRGGEVVKPSRGEVVDKLLRRTSASITLIETAKAVEGSERDRLLEEIEGQLRLSRRKLREIGILNAGKVES